MAEPRSGGAPGRQQVQAHSAGGLSRHTWLTIYPRSGSASPSRNHSSHRVSRIAGY
jgi:hypothetical protein